MHFHNHMKESDQEQVERVSKKIDAILKEEGLVFDVAMVPVIKMVREQKAPENVKAPK